MLRDFKCPEIIMRCRVVVRLSMEEARNLLSVSLFEHMIPHRLLATDSNYSFENFRHRPSKGGLNDKTMNENAEWKKENEFTAIKKRSRVLLRSSNS